MKAILLLNYIMTCHQLYYELLFITFEGELCEESSVGEDEPVADP